MEMCAWEGVDTFFGMGRNAGKETLLQPHVGEKQRVIYCYLEIPGFI